jgi:hypothetical protein
VLIVTKLLPCQGRNDCSKKGAGGPGIRNAKFVNNSLDI